jgi:hypothetical protein
MDFEVAKVVLQSLSSFAIAGGFIFTAIQFRNWKRSQQVANFTRLVELQMGLRKMRVDDPTLASVYEHDVQNLADDREVREYFFNLMQVSVFEIAWYSHEKGQLSDHYFESWRRRMAQLMAETSFQRMINNPSMKILHDEFEDYVRAMAKAHGPRGG